MAMTRQQVAEIKFEEKKTLKRRVIDHIAVHIGDHSGNPAQFTGLIRKQHGYG